MLTQRDVDDISYRVIGAAIEVHKTMGSGLLESVYHKCFLKELELRGLSFTSEIHVPLEYKGLKLEGKLRFDVLVEDLVVVELKATDVFLPVHFSQLRTYMRLMKAPKGVIINFSCTNIFKDGQKTIVNEYYSALP